MPGMLLNTLQCTRHPECRQCRGSDPALHQGSPNNFCPRPSWAESVKRQIAGRTETCFEKQSQVTRGPVSGPGIWSQGDTPGRELGVAEEGRRMALRAPQCDGLGREKGAGLAGSGTEQWPKTSGEGSHGTRRRRLRRCRGPDKKEVTDCLLCAEPGPGQATQWGGSDTFPRAREQMG